MKILMINHFPLNGSGSGTYTRNLAVHLAALGHEVRIILPENTDRFIIPDGVSIHPVFFTPDDAVKDSRHQGTTGESMDTALPFNFPCFTSHPRSSLTFGDLSEEQTTMYTDAFRSAIDKEMADFRPDLIHAQHVWILAALAAGRNVPLVITTHGTDLMGYDKWPALRRYAEEAIQACDAVISISKDNSTMLKTRFPGCADRITLLRTGYDPAVFYPEKLTRKEVLGRYWIDASEYENKRIVTYAGKLTWFKGVDILLEAIRLYEDRDPASLTLIVGDGDERSNLQWRAKDLKLKSVRFLDNVDQQELRRIFSITDAFLIPSRHEPFGLAALEAMGCGVPVIAADQGGLPDLVNQDVGRLIHPSDPEDLADKVTEVLKITSEEWRDRIAAYARTRYAQDSLTQELVELYRKLLP